jgi:hypothetical protein
VIALTHRGYELRLDQTKDYKIGLFCFFDKHAVFRSKSQEWLAQNQDNVDEASLLNLDLHRLLWLSYRYLQGEWAIIIYLQMSNCSAI